jgi:uncharacterized membrane protein affecting hemolysin expression
MLSSNSTAALSFNDSKAADELLKGLSAKRGIIAATLYTSDGQVFARYVRPDVQQEFQPPKTQPDGVAFGRNRLELFHRITLDGQAIGTVYLHSDLQEMYSRLPRFFVIAIIVLLASSMVALLTPAHEFLHASAHLCCGSLWLLLSCEVIIEKRLKNN